VGAPTQATSSDESKIENEIEDKTSVAKIPFHLNEHNTDNEEDDDDKLDVNFEVRPEKLTSNSSESFADDILANTAHIRKSQSKASQAEVQEVQEAIPGLILTTRLILLTSINQSFDKI
jgi:hypothetical protein